MFRHAVVQLVGNVLRRVPQRLRRPVVARILNLLARLVWEILLRRSTAVPPATIRLRSGKALSLDPADRLQASAYITGGYEGILADALAEVLPAGGVMFDVGANVGLVTFEVAGRVGPDVDFHCFEPFPANAAAVRRNAALNPEVRVTVVEAAVGASGGEVALEVSSRRGESGHHSVTPGVTPSHGRIQVPMLRLDDYAEEQGIHRVDVLKVDVEGAESQVLAGAHRLLEEGRVGAIVLEVNPAAGRASGPDIVGTLERLRYVAKPLPSEYASELFPRRFRSTVTDVLFVRSATAPAAENR